jgi:hypothetical protein
MLVFFDLRAERKRAYPFLMRGILQVSLRCDMRREEHMLDVVTTVDYGQTGGRPEGSLQERKRTLSS